MARDNEQSPPESSKKGRRRRKRRRNEGSLESSRIRQSVPKKSAKHGGKSVRE